MKVEIYGAGYCSYCIRAKRLAEKRNLDFRYIEVTGASDPVIKENFPNATTIPQIIVDGNPIGGYDDFAKLMG